MAACLALSARSSGVAVIDGVVVVVVMVSSVGVVGVTTTLGITGTPPTSAPTRNCAPLGDRAVAADA